MSKDSLKLVTRLSVSQEVQADLSPPPCTNVAHVILGIMMLHIHKHRMGCIPDFRIKIVGQGKELSG